VAAAKRKTPAGCFWEVPWAFWEFPAPARCSALPKAKLSISGRCSMLNLWEFEVPHIDHESDHESQIESFKIKK
jgi:hypothetical protein